MRNQKMIGPISDYVSTEQCIAVTDWPDHFLISYTHSLWAEVQTDTVEERVSESHVISLANTRLTETHCQEGL